MDSYMETPVLANQQRLLQPFCADTGFNLEVVPGAMDEKDGWW